MSRLPLHDIQAALGAHFADFGGWEKPALYVDCLTEHRTVRESVGLLDRSERGKIVITGGDRFSWLQGMITNDVRPLTEGAPAISACVLDATGHLRADLRVVRREDNLLLDLPREKLDDVFRLLEGFVVMEDVEVVDQSDFLSIISAQGPGVTADFVRACACEDEAWIVPADHTGSGGFDFYVRSDRAVHLWQQLMAAGGRPVGEEAAETLRIEAGIPKFGLDMDEKTIPLEANLEATHISHEKGCYVGQEIIARIVARGHTNRALTGLLVESSVLPRKGDLIYPTGEDAEREVGWITSACHSPSLERTIAMGYVRHENRAPGTSLRILLEDDALAATVTELPFYREK
jgi:folate-binding protein YgfZ